MKLLKKLFKSTFALILTLILIRHVSGSGKNIDYANEATTTKTTIVEEQFFQVAQFDWNSVSTPVTIVLWILAACFAKLIFHLSDSCTTIFPDSSLLIMLGLLIGLIYYAIDRTHESQLSLSHDLFFLYLLPPIVFDAGYFLPSRAFFDNFGSIMTFAILGTVWNAATIGLSLWFIGNTGMFGIEVPLFHAMLFSALLSCTDPVAVIAVFDEVHVNEKLYIVVFGEALLNDAVGVVLYEMFLSYSEISLTGSIETTDIVNGFFAFFVVGLGGVAVGVIWAFLISLTTRWTRQVRALEPLMIFVMAYCSYLTGQLFALSAILAIVFCGVAMKQYVEGNVSHKSTTTIKYCVKMFSLCAETIIFMFLGLSTVSAEQQWDTAFVTLTVLFCLIYRAIGVVFLSWILNKFRLSKLDLVDQFVLSYGGLRGAMVYGLVTSLDENLIPAKKLFVTTTIVFIYFSVFFQGMTIKPLVNFLKVKRADLRDKTMQEEILNHVADHVTAGMEQILGVHGHNRFRDLWEYVNARYIKRLLMRHAPTTVDVGIVETFTKISVREAVDHLARYGSFQSSAAVKSLTSLMKQHHNLYADDFDKRSSLVVGKPTLDMRVFDVRPGRKHTSEMRTHHDINVRKRIKHKANKGDKVSPITEISFTQIDHHNALPYKTQNVLDRKNVQYGKFASTDQQSSRRRNVTFETERDKNADKEPLRKTSSLILDYLSHFDEEDSYQCELTAAERELPWQTKVESPVPLKFFDEEESFKNIGKAENLPPPPPSPTWSLLEPKKTDNFEQLQRRLTLAELQLPWKRDLEEVPRSNPRSSVSLLDEIVLETDEESYLEDNDYKNQAMTHHDADESDDEADVVFVDIEIPQIRSRDLIIEVDEIEKF